jgi:hypothetical protein
MYNSSGAGYRTGIFANVPAAGIFTCIYNPLAGGVVNRKATEGPPSAGARFDDSQAYLERNWHPGFFEALDQLSHAACTHGRSLVSVAFNWIYRHTQADCVIPGALALTNTGRIRPLWTTVHWRRNCCKRAMRFGRSCEGRPRSTIVSTRFFRRLTPAQAGVVRGGLGRPEGAACKAPARRMKPPYKIGPTSSGPVT